MTIKKRYTRPFKKNKQLLRNFGFIKIKPTFNNIFITLTDIKGNVLISKHSGLLKFKGAKKRTPYAASQVLKDVFTEIRKKNIKIKGYILQIRGGINLPAIKTAMYSLSEYKLKRKIFYLDYSVIHAHNGLRAKKIRRL